MNRVTKGLGTLLQACTLGLVLPGLAQAGGLYIYEMGNVSETSYGGAGMAARANDAGTVFTNPAGMTRFDKSEIMAGATAVFIDGPYQPNENTTVEGSNGNGGLWIPGGSAAYIHPVSDKLKLGISAGNYFGLALEWTDGWVGRYSSVKVAMLAPQIQPTVAYKVNDWLSVGAGAALTMPYIYDKMRVDPLDPDKPDGKLRFSDADFAVQGNFGVMFTPNERTRIGVRYLTETDMEWDDAPELSGIGLPSDPFDPGTPGTDSLALDMKMPQSVLTGIHYTLNDKWNLLGSVGWDQFSEFGIVKVGLDNVQQPGTSIDADFRDVWHFGVGAEHAYKPKWTLTGGFSYDTALGTDTTTPLYLAMGSMHRYALGFKYQKSDKLMLGGGLTYLWEGNLPTKPAGGVEGKYKGVSLTFISFYARWM